MFKKLLFILTFVISSVLIAEEVTKEKVLQKSNNSIFDSTLECDVKFNTESFHNCWLEISHNDKPIRGAKVHIDGGMPAHAHGLPTAPKVKWSDTRGVYEIQGLKFSMPGEWSLNFNINLEARKLRDQITMKIEVD